jgi:nitric oxide synthase oxygenase domain/subunit
MVANEMKHVRGKPYHPQTQGKIERYHRTMKNVVKLKNYWVPGELQLELTAFVAWYNTERYHESLENLTPEDVYVGRGREIQTQRQLLKMQTLRARRCYNRGQMVGETSVIRPCSVRDSVY